uniref:Uncharacterized protein n=1 Tax=Nothobranchius furzeri TaxID=105023 RepID=A0A1A7ZQF3_NOTFU
MALVEGATIVCLRPAALIQMASPHPLNPPTDPRPAGSEETLSLRTKTFLLDSSWFSKSSAELNSGPDFKIKNKENPTREPRNLWVLCICWRTKFWGFYLVKTGYSRSSGGSESLQVGFGPLWLCRHRTQANRTS